MILRTGFMYFVVFLVMRMMGKREIGKLSVFDLVISIMIAEIAIFVIEDKNKPLLEGLALLFTLVFIQIGIAWLTLKNKAARRLFDGKPSMLIKGGKLNRSEMRKQKYNLDDLMLQLRMKDITDFGQVEFAILETNGSLSIVQKRERRSKFVPDELPLSLVMDGKVYDRHLRQIGKTRHWLKERLREFGATEFEDVFFCSMDHTGKMYVDLMDER